MLSLFLFLAFAQQRGIPIAVWIKEPLPHWHCESGLTVLEQNITMSAPHCVGQDRHFKYRETYDYDATTEELIRFDKELIIGKDGTVSFAWNPLFVRLPSCRISGDEKDHITHEENRKHITFTGKPGQHLYLLCQGAIKR